MRLSTTFRHPIDISQRPAIIDRMLGGFPESAEQEICEARGLLEHEFRLLGQHVRHGTKIRWSKDPVSDQDWPAIFAADIAYRGPQRLGDIKFPWELGKHQYFFTLGKAGWLTGDDRFPREIIAQIDDWIATNPPDEGIHWIGALEAGARAISWMLAHPFYAGLMTSRAFEARLAKSLYQHMLFVEQNLSQDEFPNTHLVGEAAALVCGGLFLDCRHSSRWLEKGCRHLERQVDDQVRPDGSHAEQSIAYHRFFLDHYYLVAAFLRSNDMSLPGHVMNVVERMTGYLRDMLWPDGSAPAFGDADDARGLWLRTGCERDYQSVLSLGALLFDRGDFKHAAGRAEDVLWLFGTNGLDRYDELVPIEPDHTSIAYPDAGYYVMRDGWQTDAAMLAFDCGPLGHGAAGHGHADALSFQLYMAGQPFLVDAGTYSYNIDYSARDLFRSTRSHNTIVVDNRDQSVMRDRMSWARIANARCRYWRTTSRFDMVDGQHDGYGELADGVIHRRIVFHFKPAVWIVVDLLEGTGRHDVAAFLHLAPDCRVDRLLPDRWEVAGTRGGALHVRVAGLDDPTGSGAEASTQALVDAPYSPAYGIRLDAPCLQITGTMAAGSMLVTTLSRDADVQVATHVKNGALLVSVQDPGSREVQLAYGLHGIVEAAVDGVDFRGRLLFRSAGSDGRLFVHADEVVCLRVDDLVDLESSQPVTWLQMADGACRTSGVDESDKHARLVVGPGIHVEGQPRREPGSIEP